VLAILSDVKRRPEWVKDLVETSILEGDVESKVIIYEHFHLPWPFSDRDSVVESTITKDLERREVRVAYHDVRHDKPPVRDGIERMPKVSGNMLFRYLDPQHCFAQFTISLSVGGSLPGFIVNQVVSQAPVDTLEGLMKQVRKTSGDYREFIRRYESK
jgi:hypothetical protein